MSVTEAYPLLLYEKIVMRSLFSHLSNWLTEEVFHKTQLRRKAVDHISESLSLVMMCCRNLRVVHCYDLEVGTEEWK